MTQNSRSIVWIEVARVTFIVGVVALHSYEWAWGPGAYATKASVPLVTMITFIVPGFFMISGYLLERSLAHRGAEQAALGERLLRLAVPLYLWNIVLWALSVVLLGAKPFSGETVWNLLTSFYGLFFIFVLVQFTLIRWLVARFAPAASPSTMLGVAAVSSLAFYAGSAIALRVYGPDGWWFEWHLGKLPFGWAVFFFWGTWLWHSSALERWSRPRFVLPLAAASLIAYAALFVEHLAQFSLGGVTRMYFQFAGLAFQFLTATLVLVLLAGSESALQRSAFWRRVGSWGSLTFGVYVSHTAIAMCLAALALRIAPDAPIRLRVLAVFVATLVSAFGATALWDRLWSRMVAKPLPST